MPKFVEIINNIKDNMGPNFRVTDETSKSVTIENIGDFCEGKAKGPWEIKIKNNGTEIWNNGHFKMRSSHDGPKIILDIMRECEQISSKETNKTVNGELCDYLTKEFENNGLKVIGKTTLEDVGIYTVRSKNNNKYEIKATFTSDTMTINKILDNDETTIPFISFNLSNPNIEQEIAKYLVEYDAPTLSKDDKTKLKDGIVEWLMNRLSNSYNYIQDGKNREFKCCVDESNNVTCSTVDSSVTVTFRITGINMREE